MHTLTKLTMFSLITCGACGAASPRPAAPVAAAPATAAKPAHHGMQIKLTSVYVHDQDKALHFYTDTLGFAKKDDISNGPFRWLTVTSPDDAEGTALQLAADDDPVGKAYQQALFQQHRPAVMFFTDDVKADYARLKARGVAFTMPPTEVNGGSTIVQLDDTCGNLVQITELLR